MAYKYRREDACLPPVRLEHMEIALAFLETHVDGAATLTLTARETRIIRDVPSSLLPKSAKICLELPVSAQMIHRVIALIANRINTCDTNNARNGLRHIENKIFRAIAMSTFCNILDQIACMIHIWPLHGSDVERIFTAAILVEPEHHLIKLYILQHHKNGEQALFSLPRC